MKARRRHLGALVAGALAAGCGATTPVTVDAGAPPPAETASASASAEPPTPPTPPRRPTRRYFFDHPKEERCEVYSVDGAQKTTPEEFPCLVDLYVGERLRIVGKTCTRESPDPERRLPAVCPDPLTNFEKRDLERDHPDK